MVASAQPIAAMPSELAPRRLTHRASDGVQLAFEQWGDRTAQPVLLAHGFGQNRLSWRATAARLAESGFQALALDGRGHGQSEWNPASLPYSMERFADDLQEIVQQQSRQPVLVGASMGGLLGLWTQARARGGLFSALVLVDITPRWESQGVARILDFMRAHPDGFDSHEHAADEIARYLPQRRERKSPEQLAGLLVQRADGRYRWHWDPRLLDDVGSQGEAYQEKLVEAARQVEVPTLLISGGLSDLVSDQTVDEFLQLVPHAEHRRIHDATHMVAGDRNDRFTDLILEFLTGQPG
jgi:pimeloyl-ACP methyl ester carboxylesterase